MKKNIIEEGISNSGQERRTRLKRMGFQAGSEQFEKFEKSYSQIKTSSAGAVHGAGHAVMVGTSASRSCKRGYIISK